jgi:GTPase SAR1 family protein
MDLKSLKRQVTHYHQWKHELDERLQAFENWGRTHKMLNNQVYKTLQRARQILRGDSFTIACVGEFSRGKTELINALLYAGGGRRLLPSQPGRTTMCPTDIFWDPAQPANCVRLLPIETRRTNTNLSKFKRIPQNWVTISFDVNDLEQMRAAINQVSASKQVTMSEAIKLGFTKDDVEVSTEKGMVMVPAWRHAMINLDHPLLRQGLRILDTPGLNALGNEPELTLKTLPEAQAILFVLSAAAGVTASDMQIWQEHIQVLRQENCTTVITLLNKIDSLWDDLNGEQEIEANIASLRKLTAKQLKMQPEHVLPISAKQGLLAKVGKNTALLNRSNFSTLERLLAECVLHNQHQIVSNPLMADSEEMIIRSYHGLARRLTECEKEISELRASVPGSQAEKLQEMREAVRKSHHDFHKQALSLRTSQRLIESQRLALLSPVSVGLLEKQIIHAHKNLAESWTTRGLSDAIGKFFDDVDSSMQHLEREIDRVNRVVKSIYSRPEHGIRDGDLMISHLLKIQKQRRRLRQLHNHANDFRGALSNFLSSKSTFISRFISSLVNEVRQVYVDINQHIIYWLREALAPLHHNNQYQKHLLEQHMLRLAQLQGTKNTLAQQVESLQTNYYQMQVALQQLEPLYQQVIKSPMQDKIEDNLLVEPLPIKTAEVVDLSSKRVPRH